MTRHSTHRFCIAPMLDYTDRHYRYLARLFTHQTRLYTEMVTTDALLYGDAHRFLQYDPIEHPVALQLGGGNADYMQRCAELAQQHGYDEININLGCPSDRVQSGQFGACLMLEPDRVANCIRAMAAVVDIPISIKTRLGVDEFDSLEFLQQLLDAVISEGSTTIILHARKAWLSGLSPKENREIPPLHYDRVYEIKRRYPDANIIINGGITSFAEIDHHLEYVDGVMLGRHAYKDPLFLLAVDQRIFNAVSPGHELGQLIEHYVEYMRAQMHLGVPLKAMAKHLLGLFQGMPGSKRWRRFLSEKMHHPTAQPELILDALEQSSILHTGAFA